MTRSRTDSKRLAELRKRAEALLEREILDMPNMSQDEIRKLVHELRTHQIELEMQNEELRRAQEELIESRDRYSDLYDFAPVGYVTVSHKGIILEANLTLADMLGFERAALDKKPFSAFIVPDDEDIFYLNRRKILETKQRCTFRLRLLRKDDEPFWAEMDSIVIDADDEGDVQLRIAISNITPYKRAEAALQESEQKFQSILENLGVGVALISPAMKILELNSQMREWFPDIDLGKGSICYQAFNNPPLTAVCEYCPAKHTFQDGKVHETETVTPRAGGIRNYRIVSSPIFNARGEVAAAIEMVEDVTDRKSLEAQLRQSQRLESVGTLAGGIAHDFNNILYAILGNTEIAIGKIQKDSNVMPCLVAVLKAGERAKALIQQILSFCRQFREFRKPIRCVPIVKETVKLLQATIPSSIEINLILKCDNDEIFSSPTEIHQILMNLCTNAAQALEESMGKIEIRLANAEVTENSKIPNIRLKPGSYIVLSVRDTGSGIHQDVLERIFDPFYTTKAPGAGTGLGLSVAHGIVKGLGGDITVKSELNAGSVFKVFIPCVEASQIHEEIKEDVVPSGSGTILVVDDEKVLVDMLYRMLTGLGYEVVTRTNGFDALEAFRKEPHKYDLVISDQTMPKMTGDKLAEELLRIRSDLPLILCTGFSMQLTEERIQELGIRKVLMKPVSKSMLAESISSIIMGNAAGE